jgi:hypothetical protein
VSVFSACGYLTPAQADAYSSALLGLLGAQDPLAVLRATPDAVRREVERFPADRLSIPEAPGKWSAAILVAHLADAELVGAFRLRLILAHERPPLTPYDQDLWATRLHYERATPKQSLERFTVLRRANLLLWAEASAEELARVGVHGERGEESVERQRRLFAGHDLAHLRQLARIRQAAARA